MNVTLFAYEDSVRYQLDLFETEPIKITLSAEEITDPTQINSAFTRQFRIPATSSNSRFFKYWYTSGVVDFDITQKVLAEIHVNGVLYKTGQLRLQAAYINNADDSIEFEVVFLGETKDFSTQVGEIFMNELDVIDTAHVLDLTLLENSWLDYGDPNLLLDGKIRYILATRGHEYDDAGEILPVPGQLNGVNDDKGSEITAQTSGSTPTRPSFALSLYPLFVSQFTPIISVKYLIDKIFERTNYTYSADSIINDPLFAEKLYVDGIGEGIPYTPTSNALVNVEIGDTIQPVPELQPIGFQIVNQNNSGAWNNSTKVYVAPADGSYSFTTSLAGRVEKDPNVNQLDAQITIRRNGVTVASATQSTQFSFLNFNFSNITASLVGANGLNAGDQVYATIEFTGETGAPFITTGSFACTASPLQIATVDLLKSDLRAIDWFKSILTKFRLIMVPSLDDPNEFIIKTWSDYIGTGDQFDWTKKIDYSKDAKIEPLFFNQASAIVFKDQEDDDPTNKFTLDTFGKVYGRRDFNSNNELLSEVKEITTEFAPTPVNQVPEAPGNSNFIIPNLAERSEEQSAYTTPAGGIAPQKIPLDVKQRLLYWNGLRPTSDITGANPIIWYYSDANTTKNSSQSPLFDSTVGSRYPCASYLSEIPSTATSLNLNWRRSFAFFEDSGGPIGGTGEDIFERYWKTYNENIYSPEARKLTAYFNLDSEDLRNLTFDDSIFIKDSYWRIQKVYDAPLGEIATVKVELIKLLNYVAPLNI